MSCLDHLPQVVYDESKNSKSNVNQLQLSSIEYHHNDSFRKKEFARSMSRPLRRKGKITKKPGDRTNECLANYSAACNYYNLIMEQKQEHFYNLIVGNANNFINRTFDNHVPLV